MQKLLKGKNTIEAAHAISQVFIEKFGTKYDIAQEILSKLILRGKSPTWASLDRNLNLFCRQFYEDYEQHEDKINFFDEIRFIIQNLPQRQDYKFSDHKLEFKEPEKAQEYFTTCAHCWRTVFKKPLQKTTPLCHLHDFPSTHPTYRKLARTKKYAEQILFQILQSIPPLNLAKQAVRAEQNEYIKSLCLNEKGVLPYLASYFNSLNMPLRTNKEIVEALEYPIQLNKASGILREAWEFYLADRAEHFKFNYLVMIRAEAWIRAEKERKHGGKRR